MQIRSKITLNFFLLTAFLLLISFFLIYYLSVAERKERFISLLSKQSTTTANLYFKINEINPDLLKEIDKNINDVFAYNNISIYDNKNKEIYTNNKKQNFKLILSQLDSKLNSIHKNHYKIFEENNSLVLGKTIAFKQKNYVVLASDIDRYGVKLLSGLKSNLIYLYVGILSFLALIGWIFSYQILKPLNEMILEINFLQFKNISNRLSKKDSKDEIAKLTDAFNQMLERVENTLVLQKSFISNASHEIINPLTSITSQIETTLLKERNSSTYKEVLEKILSDIKKLNQISEQLLLLSKYADSQEKINFKTTRIDEVLWTVKNNYLLKHPDSKVNLIFGEIPNDEDKLLYEINETLLTTCFTNLIDNGIKFSDSNEIIIKLFIVKDQLVIDFENDGSGLQASEIPKLFSPFYRGNKSTEKSGFGIGLSIVKSILDLHNFKISVTSKPTEKTVFRIEMPQDNNSTTTF